MRNDPWKRRAKLFSGSVPKDVRHPKTKWRVLPILWMAFKRSCMVLGALVLLSTIVIAWSLSSVVDQIDTSLPQDMVLYLELEGSLGDVPAEAGFASPLAKPGMTVRHFTDALYRAAEDPRVLGLYAKFENGSYALAHIEEMRKAILAFRASGKFAYIYAPSYSNGLGAYYLASAFEQVWMQPMGIILIPGLNAEIPFFRKAVDRLGIEPLFFQRNEYKSAYDSVTRHDISDAHRDNMYSLLEDIYSTITSDIARDRDLSTPDLSALIDKGVLLSKEALDYGLIDHLDYADVLEETIKEKVRGKGSALDVNYVGFGRYVGDTVEAYESGRGFVPHITPVVFDGSGMGANKKKSNRQKKPVVALVHAVGAIMDDDGTSARSPLVALGGDIAAADKISDALYDISEDDSIDAVVLRVNSPGGSPVASETILRAIQKVQESGKTVTVSMGPVAASGGYWISASADQIFVSDTTITGSIGVLGGKLSVKEMWDSIGVRWARITFGENAGIFSLNTPFSDKEGERINAMLDDIYANFIKRVAHGRNMSEEQVEKIAGGRVWSGSGAIDVGLADQLGGLDEALDYAAVQVGGESRADVRIVVMPKPLSQLERFLEVLEGNVSVYEMFLGEAGVFSSFYSFVQPHLIMQTSPAMVYEPVSIK